tara:strand:- start:32640 stop:33743 length:1104 start_codon:yes stop_codon:yes gene_type:complete
MTSFASIPKTVVTFLVLFFSLLVLADTTNDFSVNEDPFRFDLSLLAYKSQNISTLHMNNRILKGPLKGEELDSSEKRPTVIVHQDGDRWIIANFHHIDKFYFASIPVNEVENTFFNIVKFMPGAAHAMLRFKMKKGKYVTLLAEGPSEDEFKKGITVKPLERPILLSDIFLSVESTWTKGRDGYELHRIFKGHYVNTFRMVSLATRAMTYYRDDTVPTEQVKTNFSFEESSEALKRSIELSDKYGQFRPYNLFKRNCATEVFEVIDFVTNKFRSGAKATGIKERYHRMLNRFVGFVRFYPLLSKYVLVWAGLTEGKGRVTNLELEAENGPIYKLEKERQDFNRAEEIRMKRALCLKVYEPATVTASQ